jgi:ABC-type lipoprotein export system ATPase subunit
MPDKDIIVIEELVKIYKSKDIEVLALQGLDLRVKKGEIVAIIGSSGSGKSTLLNMIGGLDKPSSGKLLVCGKDLLSFSQKDFITYKRDTVGFVWQNSARNLIPYLTAYENIEIPMILSGKKDKAYALELLEMVGLTHRKNNKLSELSGGEQQRVAIATALANKPEILLADEPTGAVDTKTAGMILDVFRNLRDKLGITIVIVTHDNMISNHVERVVSIRDGKTSSEFILKEEYRDFALQNTAERTASKETHDEFVVVDRYGRLQLPKNFAAALGIDKTGKARVELRKGEIIITAPETEEN